MVFRELITLLWLGTSGITYKHLHLKLCHSVNDTNLLPHTEILFLIIIKQLPLLPQLVLGPGPGQVAGGEQWWQSVERLLRSVPGRLFSVWFPLGCRGNVPFLLHRFLLPQQRAREVGSVLKPWTPFLLQYQRGHKLRDNFIPLAYSDKTNQVCYLRFNKLITVIKTHNVSVVSCFYDRVTCQ